MKKYFIDLFAGAGGLTEGFLCNGFCPLAHVEMNNNACETLKTRLAYHYLKQKDSLNIYWDYLRGIITKQELLSNVDKSLIDSVINKAISLDSINSIFETIDANIKKNNATVDVIIGGPPCQAYSLVGRSVQGERVKSDERNWLYKLYVKFLEKYKPNVFVFENVTGLMSAAGGEYYRSLMASLEKARYNIESKVIDASDYGVLQKRKRVIIIGVKKGLRKGNVYPLPNDISSKYYVNDVLSDLPSLSKKIECNIYKEPITDYCRETGIREDYDILTWHVKRNNNDIDREIYKTAIELWNKKRKRLDYNDLPERLKKHKNRNSFVDRFKVIAGDEHCSQTILAHLAKDGHYFIHPSIKECRSISVREAARLQSFPDSYYFEGSRGAAFTQIGNAVPPLLSKAIAKAIKDYLREIENDNS